MKRQIASAVLMACLSWTSVAWSVEEGEAIEKTVKEAAMAAATFSETRDKQAVMKLYSKDYVGIQDGETETRDSIEKWFSDYESELASGSTLRFISVVSNLRVRTPGPTAILARVAGPHASPSHRGVGGSGRGGGVGAWARWL